MNTIRNICPQPFLRVLIVFFFFSIADFFLTWKLIERDASDVVESNPLAAIVLASYGWLGLAGYKFALIMTFFALAMMVERRRPLGGLLLLVFACGVHAAVVTSSGFLFIENARADTVPDAMPEFYLQQRQSLPVGGMTLLSQKCIQDELSLSEKLIRGINHAIQKRRELSREITTGHLDSCQSQMLLIVQMEHHLMLDLSPKQMTRLQQLALQKRGILAILDADVAVPLEFTDEQRTEIYGIVEKYPLPPKQLRRRRMDNSASKEINSLTQRRDDELLCVLTQDQKARWSAMQGPPFCFQTGRTLQVAAQATE